MWEFLWNDARLSMKNSQQLTHCMSTGNVSIINIGVLATKSSTRGVTGHDTHYMDIFSLALAETHFGNMTPIETLGVM